MARGTGIPVTPESGQISCVAGRRPAEPNRAQAGQRSASSGPGSAACWRSGVTAYAVTAPLYHAGASHPVWGLYPASAPLLIIGLLGAATAAARHDWPMAGTCLAVAIVAAAAAAGPRRIAAPPCRGSCPG